MAQIPNGIPHLELSINQKMVENALNRFLTSVLVTNDIEFKVINLRFLARSGGDPLNAVHVRFNLGIAGAALDDWAELKLYLDGPRREKIRVDYVDREKDSWFDIITELKWGLVLVDLLKPVILELPTDLDGRQVQYYLKAEEGNLILAATYTGLNTLFNEALFHAQYRGCTAGNDRFGFAANHRVIKQTLVRAINSFESGDLRLHDISEGNIGFKENKVKVVGGFTSEAPCGPGSVNLDLNYAVEAEFINNQGNLDVIVDFHVDFADFGERLLATFCGILEAVESRRLYLPFLALVFDVATIAGLFMAEAEANRIADQQLDLYDYRTTGIGFLKEGERRWRVMVRPVAALKEWGGLLWPMRITRIDLDAGGRVLVTGNQDLDPDEAGAQEADFGGGYETRWCRRHEIKYNMVGSPGGFDEAIFRLVKNDNSLYAVVGWELVDDAHRCFSVSGPPSILSGSNLPVGDTRIGSMVLSPQNEIRIRVRFGPDFYRHFDQGEGEGYWVKYTPGPGASFSAKLKVTYVSKDEAGRWVIGDTYIDLHGIVSLSLGLDAPIDRGIKDLFNVMPDEILEIGEELQADWDIWDDLPRVNDLDYIEVACHQKAVQEVTVTDTRGNTYGRAFVTDYKILSVPTDPKQDYIVTSMTGEGGKGGRFMVQRMCYEHRHTVTMAEPIHGYAYKNNLLAVNTGTTVALYHVGDTDNMVELGRTKFRSNVRHLAPTVFGGSTGFIAADDSTLRIVGAPDIGRRTIVKQERKLSALSGQESLSIHEGTIYGASEKGVTVIGRQLKVDPSTRVVKPLRAQALNIRAEQSLFAGDWLLARTGNSLQVYKAPWLGSGQLGSIRVQPTGEFRVKGWNAYIYDGRGKTTVVSLMDPSKPVVVAEYKESERSWRIRPEGHRAFEVHPSGKSLMIYRRKPRRINMKKLSEATLARIRV